MFWSDAGCAISSAAMEVSSLIDTYGEPPLTDDRSEVHARQDYRSAGVNLK